MANEGVTLFTWGYEGWGNWTDKLVEAVDAVESSRGLGPPLFVDIRASRKVRAEGFREKAFEKRFGLDRYRWMNRLGNEAILTGEKYGKLIDPTCAGDLLDLAVNLQSKHRRVIYFCSCASPTDGCHRHWVAPELFKAAKQRHQPVTVVEWPGYESDLDSPTLNVIPSMFQALCKGTRTSVPLGDSFPEIRWLSLPWWAPVKITSGNDMGFIYSGPAQHRAGGWQLPFLAGVPDEKPLALMRRARNALVLLPLSWPSGEPSQRPAEWRPPEPEKQGPAQRGRHAGRAGRSLTPGLGQEPGPISAAQPMEGAEKKAT